MCCDFPIGCCELKRYACVTHPTSRLIVSAECGFARNERVHGSTRFTAKCLVRNESEKQISPTCNSPVRVQFKHFFYFFTDFQPHTNGEGEQKEPLKLSFKLSRTHSSEQWSIQAGNSEGMDTNEESVEEMQVSSEEQIEKETVKREMVKENEDNRVKQVDSEQVCNGVTKKDNEEKDMQIDAVNHESAREEKEEEDEQQKVKKEAEEEEDLPVSSHQF